MSHSHDDEIGLPASRTLAEVTPPPPHPFWLTLLATVGGLVIPAIAAIAAALLLGPPQVPHASRTAALAAAALTIAEAIFAGLGAAALVEAAWRRMGLPGSGPANFLPLRWIRHRIAHRHVQTIIDNLKRAPAQPSRESLRALLDLSRELARRDIYTRAHSGRVSRLSVEVGQRIGLSPEECEMARLAGLLHDIGKLEIPPSILNKPGPLDPDEAELVRNHPMIGAALVSPYIGADVVNAVRHHHERVDGAGYPDGVDGDALPVIARLVPVVDTYDALISDRAYRPGRSREEAFMELRAVAGTQLDADMVEALIEVERAKVPFGGALLGLAPVGALFRKAEHLLHGSAAPAAAAVTAIAVAGAGWLGVMSSTVGTHVLASKYNSSIVKTSPSATVDQPASTDSPAPAVDTTPTGSPVPSPSPGATGKTPAPLYFPIGAGKGTGTGTGAGVLVTPAKTTKTSTGTKVTTPPTVIAVGPPGQPLPNPTTNPNPNPAPTPSPGKTNPPPPPPPTIGSVSPLTGGAGITVSIDGANFGPNPTVSFGNTQAASGQVGASAPATPSNGSHISVTVPPGSGSQQIHVSVPGVGTANGPNFVYQGPAIQTVNPLFGPPGGGAPVTIHGSNFGAVQAVSFGGITVPVNSASDTDVQVTSPSFQTTGAPELDVCVQTPAGKDCTSRNSGNPSDQQYDYQPDLEKLSPTSGTYRGGSQVTLSGANFASDPGNVYVTFGSTKVSANVLNDGTISVTVPAWPGPTSGHTVSVRVYNSVGPSDDNGLTYTYNGFVVPQVNGISPNSASVTASVTVTISGSGFSTGFGDVVAFGGIVPSNIVVVDDSHITCTEPVGIAGTTVDIRVATVGGTSSPNVNDRFTYTL